MVSVELVVVMQQKKNKWTYLLCFTRLLNRVLVFIINKINLNLFIKMILNYKTYWSKFCKKKK